MILEVFSYLNDSKIYKWCKAYVESLSELASSFLFFMQQYWKSHTVNDSGTFVSHQLQMKSAGLAR